MINQQINLFHPMFRRERTLLSFDTVLQITLITLVALASVYGYGSWSGHRLQQTASSLHKLKTHKLLQLEELQRHQKMLTSGESLATHLEKMRRQYAAKQLLMNTMSDLQNARNHGFSEYLEAFSHKVVSGMWLTGFSVSGDGHDLELRGGALDPRLVPEFVQSLADVPILARIEFRVLRIDREHNGGDRVNFVLGTGTDDAGGRP